MDEILIDIEQGRLRGCKRTTDRGFQYDCYFGIPYAKPPIGELRFKDPQLPEAWSGIRDATKHGNICPQINLMLKEGYRGEEDSLILNIYVPLDAKKVGDLPVMVFIHGGAFIMGSGEFNILGPDYLVEKEAIVVTINYRLGIFGFMCLHTPENPGNAGLKDQIFALRWIQRNIRKFGGNPDNVTIFGESAGGGSVSYLLVSSMSDGLFHKAITQSGVCTSNWAYQASPEETAFKLAEALGCSSKNKEDVLQFFREKPADELVNYIYGNFIHTTMYSFIPVVEKVHSGIESYITEPAQDLLAAGKFKNVPTMIGYNNQEGLLFIIEPLFIGDINKVRGFDDLKIPMEMLLMGPLKNVAPENKEKATNMIANFYFKNPDNFVDEYIEFMSDVTFTIEIDKSIKALREKNDAVYFYQFSYNGNVNLYKTLTDYPYKGAAHADEIPFMFKINYDESFHRVYRPERLNPKDGEFDELMRERFLEMWVNFARFGKPTPDRNEILLVDWLPVNKDKIHCFNIDKELKIIDDPLCRKAELWDAIARM